jgi:hypothetical protein
MHPLKFTDTVQFALCRRHGGLWLLLRLLRIVLPNVSIAAAGVVSRAATPGVDWAVVLVVGFLGLVDGEIHQERVLRGNLGVGPTQFASLCFGPPLALEVIVLLVHRIL